MFCSSISTPSESSSPPKWSPIAIPPRTHIPTSSPSSITSKRLISEIILPNSLKNLLSPWYQLLLFRPSKLNRNSTVHNLMIIELLLCLLSTLGIVINNGSCCQGSAKIVLVYFADI